MSGKSLIKSTALVALAVASVATPAIANAQERDHDRGGGEHRGWGGGERGGGREGGWNRGQQQQAAPQAQQQQFQAQRQQQMQAQQQVQAQAQAQARIDGQRGGWQGRWQGQERGQAAQQPGGNWQGRYQGQAQQYAPVYRNNGYVDQQRNRSYTERHDGDRQWRGQYQGQYYGGRQQAWNNDWRRDRRYDWRGYRNEHREVFRAGRYYAPFSGYYYRPLSIGFYLDQAFFGQDYWIGDPEYYRLPPAYGPYRWVRYYDDVLLVNIYNGEVVDVIRGFFY